MLHARAFPQVTVTTDQVIAELARSRHYHLTPEAIRCRLGLFAAIVCERAAQNASIEIAGLGAITPAPRGGLFIFSEA